MRISIDANISPQALCYQHMKKWILKNENWVAVSEDAFVGSALYDFDRDVDMTLSPETPSMRLVSLGGPVDSHSGVFTGQPSQSDYSKISEGICQVLSFRHKKWKDIQGTLTVRYTNKGRRSWDIRLEGGLVSHGPDSQLGFPDKLEETYHNFIVAYGISKRATSLPRKNYALLDTSTNPAFGIDYAINSGTVDGSRMDTIAYHLKKGSSINAEFIVNHPMLEFDFSNEAGQYVFRHKEGHLYVVTDLEGSEVKVESHSGSKYFYYCRDLNNILAVSAEGSLKDRLDSIRNAPSTSDEEKDHIGYILEPLDSPSDRSVREEIELDEESALDKFSAEDFARNVNVSKLESIWTPIEDMDRETVECLDSLIGSKG